MKSKNIYVMVACAAVSISVYWVYRQIIKPRLQQRHVSRLIEDLNEWAKDETKVEAKRRFEEKSVISKM